ncbi:hypothetical protein BKI52_38335 [marine bacterium AO1-C]|nr:hypothetical protein BKI52_38335 [marine bacterium AO1-C]
MNNKHLNKNKMNFAEMSKIKGGGLWTPGGEVAKDETKGLWIPGGDSKEKDQTNRGIWTPST